MYYLRLFDPWKNPLCTCPPKYSLQPYTGCSHKCLYCYATSYIGLRESQPKRDFINKLLKDLRKANKNLPVSISNSSDPYPPIEKEILLTRKTIKLLLEKGFKILIITKSDLVVRDIDILKNKRVAVSITITTLNDRLAKIIEPYAPPPSDRLKAVRKLSKNGIPVAVRVDPVIPLLNDDPYELRELVEKVVEAGASHIVTSTYKVKPDNFARMIEAFPDKASKWKLLYYKQGVYLYGYRYLNMKLRKKLLKPVVEAARKLGITYATCREGLLSKDFFNALSCDGTHLIPLMENFSRGRGYESTR